MSEKPSNTLPKWPFLAGDIVLVLLACFIVFASPRPMPALTIFACILSVILGMLVFVTPYLIEHLTVQQSVKLKQVKAEETLLKAAELAADLLNRTETIHAELMKSVLVTKQVPAKLEEKAEEYLNLLSHKENEEIVSLKNEIETLKVLESDKLLSAVSELSDLIGTFESTASTLRVSGNKKNDQELLDLLKSLRKESLSTTESLKYELSQLKDEVLAKIGQTETSAKSNKKKILNEKIEVQEGNSHHSVEMFLQ